MLKNFTDWIWIFDWKFLCFCKRTIVFVCQKIDSFDTQTMLYKYKIWVHIIEMKWISVLFDSIVSVKPWLRLEGVWILLDYNKNKKTQHKIHT